DGAVDFVAEPFQGRERAQAPLVGRERDLGHHDDAVAAERQADGGAERLAGLRAPGDDDGDGLHVSATTRSARLTIRAWSSWLPTRTPGAACAPKFVPQTTTSQPSSTSAAARGSAPQTAAPAMRKTSTSRPRSRAAR